MTTRARQRHSKRNGISVLLYYVTEATARNNVPSGGTSFFRTGVRPLSGRLMGAIFRGRRRIRLAIERCWRRSFPMYLCAALSRARAPNHAEGLQPSLPRLMVLTENSSPASFRSYTEISDRFLPVGRLHSCHTPKW